MRRAAHPSGRARCGAGAGCSAIKYQSFSNFGFRVNLVERVDGCKVVGVWNVSKLACRVLDLVVRFYHLLALMKIPTCRFCGGVDFLNWGLGIGVQGLGCAISTRFFFRSSGFRVHGIRTRIYGVSAGFRNWDVWCECRVEG